METHELKRNSKPSNWFKRKYKKLMDSVKDRKNSKHIKHLEFIGNMTSWEYTVYDAFHTRLRISELSEGSEAFLAYDTFLQNPDNKVAQLLASSELHGWRPTGITYFAKLIEIDKARNDDAVIQAIRKSSTISCQNFKEEYSQYVNTKSLPPKLILETVLFEDYGITLNPNKSETKKVYDGLRRNDSKAEI